jgi:hypothetical protein
MSASVSAIEVFDKTFSDGARESASAMVTVTLLKLPASVDAASESVSGEVMPVVNADGVMGAATAPGTSTVIECPSPGIHVTGAAVLVIVATLIFASARETTELTAVALETIDETLSFASVRILLSVISAAAAPGTSTFTYAFLIVGARHLLAL